MEGVKAMKKLKKLLASVGMMLAIPAAVYLIFCIVRPNVFLHWSAVYLAADITDFLVAAERTLGAVLGAILSRTMGIPGLILGCFLVAIAPPSGLLPQCAGPSCLRQATTASLAQTAGR